MNKEKQRIKIAEACGWTANKFGKWSKDGEVGPNGVVPDYLNDLNAMHGAEKVLSVAQRITYAQQIGVVMSGGSVGRAIPNWWFIHEATAAQRARAFLETLGLWEEKMKIKVTYTNEFKSTVNEFDELEAAVVFARTVAALDDTAKILMEIEI